jgi:hypothetical protein
MSKFLYGLVILFILCLGLGVLGTLRPPSTRAYDDPTMAQVKACAHKHERMQHATTDDHKTELLWWCMRQHYGIN